MDRDWGSYMNKMNVAPIIRKDLNLALYEDDILGTKKMVWSGVRFDHPGEYDVIFMADNSAKLFVNDELLRSASTNFKGNNNSAYSLWLFWLCK